MIIIKLYLLKYWIQKDKKIDHQQNCFFKAEKSFHEMKEYWMELVRENGPKKIIMHIVGDKIDLQEKEDVNEDDARKYVKNENANFWFTLEKDSTCIDEILK